MVLPVLELDGTQELGYPLPSHATFTTRSASGNGSRRRRTASTTLKIALFAPMPSARVTTAKPLDGGLQERIGRVTRPAVLLEIARCHVSVGKDTGPVRKPLQLDLPRSVHPLANRLTRLPAPIHG